MTAVTTKAGDRPDRSDLTSSSHESRRGMLAWCLTTTGLLVGGGALRVAGSAARRPEDLSVVAPFPLDTIPRTLDGWKAQGEDARLDPVTTRITGATDHVGRLYYDEITGTALSVLILYGPAEPVLPHTPQVCYPASGYRSLAEPTDRTITINDRLSAVFRVALFGKSGGRNAIRQAVYHSYRLDGVWSPAINERNLPRRSAGLFKVQIQRHVLDGERIGIDEPIESFLRHLLPEMERMLADPHQAAEVSTARPVATAR